MRKSQYRNIAQWVDVEGIQAQMCFTSEPYATTLHPWLILKDWKRLEDYVWECAWMCEKLKHDNLDTSADDIAYKMAGLL